MNWQGVPRGTKVTRLITKEPIKAKGTKNLDALFHDTLKDIYYAEKKVLATLPKMAKAATNDELKATFEKHRDETETHVSSLEDIFGMIDKKSQGKKCAAIVGITEEGAEVMKEYKGSPALDAGLLAAAQAVEHYEISRYGTLTGGELGREPINLLGRRSARVRYAPIADQILSRSETTRWAIT
jgi:ferritin-like metal-binding protein YciE